MKVIAGGRGAVNPYAAIARPYLDEVNQKLDVIRRAKIEAAFNKLSTGERKAIYVLGNEKAEKWPGKMELLSQTHIDYEYSHFNEKEKLTLICGMMALKHLSAKVPYSMPGEEALARITRETEVPDAKKSASNF